MITEDSASEMERIIEIAKQNLISNDAEIIGKYQIKMRICYPNITIENSEIKTEIFLFNKLGDKVSHVLCKNKLTEDSFDIVNFNL